ncbi:alanine racemase [Leucobacter albus]|uniref:alanine racemase n=1 Tax=Leucobacter albus TaxID=272210 RepID=UPI00363624DC
MRVAEISLPALRHNIETLRRHTGAKVIVVVKADAYGHGAAIVAPAVIAAGAAIVAAASIEEAVALRSEGFCAPILCWLHEDELDYAAAVRGDIQLGLSTVTQVRRLTAAARSLGAVASAHLKLDTGLSRNGAAPASWQAFFAEAAAAEAAGHLRVRGIFSHLANAGDAADRAQAARFDAGTRLLRTSRTSRTSRTAHTDPAGRIPSAPLGSAPLGSAPTAPAQPMRHLAASAAALTSPHLSYDAVRIGAAAYGLSPAQDDGAARLGLRPVMTFATEIVSLRRATAGQGETSTSTNTSASAPANARTALLAQLPVGFADGMPRALGGTGLSVAVGGERAPLVGEIAMDECLIDVTHLAGRVAVGDRVVLFGDPARGEPAVEEWAERLGTINYEVVARIGRRVQRRAVGRGYPPRETPTHLSPSVAEGEF